MTVIARVSAIFPGFAYVLALCMKTKQIRFEMREACAS